MRFERLATVHSAEYAQAMALYHASFPFHEQREAESQAGIMGHEDYRFYLIYDGDAFVGMMLCWETPQFIYVEHFCIQPSMRGRGYGAGALSWLLQRGKTVILEIDPPVDDISVRRKAFYERANFHANPYVHDHPAYHAGYAAHRLVVMSSPAALTQAQYTAFAQYLSAVVMEK